MQLRGPYGKNRLMAAELHFAKTHFRFYRISRRLPYCTFRVSLTLWLKLEELLPMWDPVTVRV